MQSSIESRVETLEAIAAIPKLKALTCYHADRYDAEVFAAPFAEDGVFEGAWSSPRRWRRLREPARATCAATKSRGCTARPNR